MASYRIPAIKNFDFAARRVAKVDMALRAFRQASDLGSKSEEVQISTLVYSMGDKAEDLLQSFNLNDEEVKK